MRSIEAPTVLLEGGAEPLQAAAAILQTAGIDHTVGVADGDLPGS